MARIEVRQLRFRGEPAKAARVEFAVADALRTEVVDDERLVLVRNFQLGRIGLAERGASRAAAAAWRTILEGARHGGSSGAESANCVWFADAAEARALLMRELAAGRTPFAWFWVLAVPDWRRETLGRWLARRLDEAERDGSGETAAALIGETLAADCVASLVTALLARIPQAPIGRPPTLSREQAVFENGDAARAQQVLRLLPVEDAVGGAAALAIARLIPAPLRAVLATAAARPETAAFVEALVRGLVLRAHPALALTPVRVAPVVAEVLRALRFGEPHIPAASGGPHATSGHAPPVDAEASANDKIDRALSPMFRAGPEPETTTALVAPLSWQISPATDLVPIELRSSAAGLFLAIAPLVRLGWREWLTGRPHLLLHQPGPRLLRRIAIHYRVPAPDALWNLLPPVDQAGDPPSELEQALHLWRAGLDGWLRRKARLRLADLVLRRGWILPGVETTLVRFPLEAIEIRLRRLALDGDPGWVDWLGHSYRVVYRDRPLLGPEPR